MSKSVSERMLGAGKVLWGSVGVASGVSTSVGGGMVGHFLYAHGARAAAVRYGTHKAKESSKLVAEGWKELFED